MVVIYTQLSRLDKLRFSMLLTYCRTCRLMPQQAKAS